YDWSLIRHTPTTPLIPYTTLLRSRAGLDVQRVRFIDGHQHRSVALAQTNGYFAVERHHAFLCVDDEQDDVCGVDGYLHLVQCRRSEEHTSELQSLRHLVCRLLLEK